MRTPTATLFLLLLVTQRVVANTEKVIFRAHSTHQPPALHTSRIGGSLSPASPRLHTQLAVAFPSKEQPRGTESWYLLRELIPGQRYELRVCWLATKPTRFRLETYTVSDVFAEPELLRTLAYSAAQLPDLPEELLEPVTSAQESTLFLRIQSTADFYTLNETLLSNPPAVEVDIVLDPYVFNTFPRSLLPISLYLSVIVVASLFLSGAIARWLHSIGEKFVEKKTG